MMMKIKIEDKDFYEAYHILTEHPGAVNSRASQKSTRVPAADIAHVRRIDRAGQTRGVPWMAPVMMTLGELSDYQEAQILKQRMSALMAAILASPEGVVASPALVLTLFSNSPV